MFTIIIIIIIMQNHKFIIFHSTSCLLQSCGVLQYCVLVGTLCELYYNLCECQEQTK